MANTHNVRFITKLSVLTKSIFQNSYRSITHITAKFADWQRMIALIFCSFLRKNPLVEKMLDQPANKNCIYLQTLDLVRFQVRKDPQ